MPSESSIEHSPWSTIDGYDTIVAREALAPVRSLTSSTLDALGLFANPINFFALRRSLGMLRQYNVALTTVQSRDQALRVVQNEEFDVIFIDDCLNTTETMSLLSQMERERIATTSIVIKNDGSAEGENNPYWGRRQIFLCSDELDDIEHVETVLRCALRRDSHI